MVGTQKQKISDGSYASLKLVSWMNQGMTYKQAGHFPGKQVQETS